MEPSTCPWCGLRNKIYIRAGSELVCTDCVEKDAAMDAVLAVDYDHLEPPFPLHGGDITVRTDATWNEGGD